MRRIFPLTLIFMLVVSAFLAFSEQTVPEAEADATDVTWTKYVGNPLNLENNANNPWVILDGTTYKTWYGLNNEIYYATSSDGISWSTHGKVLPKGSSGSWEAYLTSLCVVLDGTTYKMWYTGGGSERRGAIGYANSSDGVSWTKYSGNPVLTHGNGGWDGWSVVSPSVLKEGTAYKMWYCAQSVSNGKQHIGYATSSDGVSWTKYSSNPVLAPGGNGGWDDAHASCQFVMKEGLTFEMWYAGQDSSGRNRIGFASSTDGISWTKYSSNPVLPVGSPGEWDDNSVTYPRIVQEGNTYKMWYVGTKSGGTTRIGLASCVEEQEIHLPVPFESQGSKGLCASASTSMVLRYYGKKTHVWDITGDFFLGKVVWLGVKVIDDYINLKYPTEFVTRVAEYEDVTDATREEMEDCLRHRYPVILQVETGKAHVVVVTGFNLTGFFINDPSGALFESLGKGYQQYSIHRYVNWEELKPKIFDGERGRLQGTFLVVQGEPHPAEATLWTADTVPFYSLLNMILASHENDPGLGASVDYGLMTGLNWRSVGYHSSNWDAKDKLYYQFKIFNHKSEASTFDVVFRIEGDDFAYQALPIVRQVAGNSDESIFGNCLLNAILPSVGYYVASCDLYDHLNGTLVDSVELPAVYYGFSLVLQIDSPVDVLVTDPAGLRVGFDNVSKISVTQIPGAYYSGNGSEPQLVSIPAPLPGVYAFDFYGTGTGSYSLVVELRNEDGVVTDSETWSDTTFSGKHDIGSIVLSINGNLKGYPHLVIPDLPMGTISALISTLMALAIYIGSAKWRRKIWHYT